MRWPLGDQNGVFGVFLFLCTTLIGHGCRNNRCAYLSSSDVPAVQIPSKNQHQRWAAWSAAWPWTAVWSRPSVPGISWHLWPGRRYHHKQSGSRNVAKEQVSMLSKKPCHPAVPSLFLSNVCSLDNKLDCIRLLQTTQREFRDCCIFVFTETRLSNRVPDTVIQQDAKCSSVRWDSRW